jgi:enoyl-CoA hydratase/carnithine racemase
MSGSEGVHVIRLANGKANAIDDRLASFLEDELDRALTEGANAVVLTGRNGFFSAGLDLKGLPDDEAGMAAFLDRFEACNRKLFELPLPLVTAVNGHAIAGGCVLASTGDVRLGAEGSYKVGVSEVSLGIVFPASAFEIMRHTLHPRFTPEVLLAGRLLDPAGAVEAGILHRLVPSERLLDEAVAVARELGSKPRRAFQHSKIALRAPVGERIEKTRDEARRLFLETWFSPDVVERRKTMLK